MNLQLLFAVGFYDALAAGRDIIGFAHRLDCSAIQMEGIEEHLTPVLLMGPGPLPGEGVAPEAEPTSVYVELVELICQ